MKYALLLCSAILLSGCSGFNLDNLFNRNEYKQVVVDAEICTNEETKDVELTEGSTIFFSDEYMIIRTGNQEIKVPLDEMSKISYK